MEKVSAMKKIALFLMIVGLAVALVACQGAVGPKGDDGADGVDGTDGTDGTAAFQPLSAKAESPSVVITDATDEDNMPVAGAAQTIDLAEYIYGTADRTYGTPESSIATANRANRVFDAKLDGSMLTITPKATPPALNLRYNVEIFKVKISDGGESTAIFLDIPARRNRSPEATEDEMATVGNQAPDEAPDEVRVCTANAGAGANECYVDVTFTDEDRATTGGEEKLSFTATSSDTSKVEVVSFDNAPGQDPDVDPPMPLVARLVIKGIASTWDADATSPGHDPVEVVVVATDAGGETVRGKAQITVDGAPTAETIPGGTISQAMPLYTITDVRGFFKNPESAADINVTIPADDLKSSNTNVATVAVDGNGMVTVTRVARGTAEITITALEPTDQGPAQTGSATFTVTVTD